MLKEVWIMVEDYQKHCVVYNILLLYILLGEKPNIGDVKNACEKMGLKYVLQV